MSPPPAGGKDSGAARVLGSGTAGIAELALVGPSLLSLLNAAPSSTSSSPLLTYIKVSPRGYCSEASDVQQGSRSEYEHL